LNLDFGQNNSTFNCRGNFIDYNKQEDVRLDYTRTEIDAFDIDEEYFQPIVNLYLLSLAHYKRFFLSKNFDITPQQWHALNRLWRQDGISQAKLAKKTYKDYSFTTRLLDDLEKKKLVIRVKDPGDRRVNKIYLTDEGRDFKYKIIPSFLEMSEKLREGLSDEELLALRRLCLKLIRNYQEHMM
jgi:DNA-binding MarR family transcriptional regulator